MSEMNTVKIDLEIPNKLYKALNLVAEKFDETIESIIIDFINECLKGHAEAGFDDFIEPFKQKIIKLLN